MKKTSAILALAVVLLSAPAWAANYQYTGLWAQPGLSLQTNSVQGVEVVFSLDKLSLEDVVINKEAMQAAAISAMVLPNQAGAPDVPSISRYLAIPQGATARVEVISKETEVIKNVNLAPAPVIPNEREDGLTYFKDQAIYSANRAYPDWIAKVSEPTSLRGVDAVIVAISPLQYNPATKELFVHRNIRVRVSFEGGNGRFGEDRLRSRWWDPILQGNLVNYEQLPKVDYDKRAGTKDGCEYVIIVPNDANYIAWADTIKQWRQLQGISTGIYTINNVGSDSAQIKAWILNAYTNWGTPPVAVLLVGDYPGQGNSIPAFRYSHPYPGYPQGYYPSDNTYADMNGDVMPDLNLARIPAGTTAGLPLMIRKFLEQERNPTTNANFYNNPLVACGWQTERWFQLCTEIVRGFFNSTQGKNCAHVYKIYSGTPTVGGAWSSNTNTPTVVNYFNNLGYIPLTNPYDATYWNSGTAAQINSAINSGAFVVQHRDHGWEYGWGEPAYTQANARQLTNTTYPFVFSINCMTGGYQQTGSGYDSVCLGEAFYRQQYGVLGVIAPTEVSYSFVNDTYIFGIYDCMFPNFDPGYNNGTHLFGDRYLMPGFANAYAKYYLQASSWPYNPGDKQITYRLFHMYGEPFTTLYSEVPQDLTVSHDGVLLAGLTSFPVTVNEAAFIALTVNGEIIGTGTAPAKGTADITIPAQTPGSTMIVTITKPNYRRYSAEVSVIASSGAFVLYQKFSVVDTGGINDGLANPGESLLLPVWVKNLGSDASNGAVICTLKTASPYVSLTEAVLDYGTIDAGVSAVCLPGFALAVTNDCPHGTAIPFQLVSHDGDTAWTSQFSLTIYVSRLNITPDNNSPSPLYYAIEDSDAAPRAPVYQWTEIRDIGTQLTGLISNDATVRLALPFPFRWYDTTYGDSISVCTNGWMAFGRVTGTTYFNSSIPSSIRPDPAVFPLWDNLDCRTSTFPGCWVGYWHDAANNRLILEWDSVGIVGSASRVKFQVVLEESTAARPYYDVVLQYNIYNNPNNSASIGFQKNSTVGCQMMYDTSLALTARAPINGRAVRITGSPEGPTGVTVQPEVTALPKAFRLSQAFPNPMRQSSSISYQLPKPSAVSLKVFNVLGQLVQVLDEGAKSPGTHTVRWDGRDHQGRQISAGVYFFRLETLDYTGTGRLTVVR